MFLWTRRSYLRDTVKIYGETSTKKIRQHHHVVNVSCMYFNDLKAYSTPSFSYKCQRINENSRGIHLMWSTSVSDHCCQNCNGVVYKADSVIDTIHHEDKCRTIETSVCRILPGRKVCNVEMKCLISNSLCHVRSREGHSH